MIKVIAPGSYSWSEPAAQLVKTSDRGLRGNDLDEFIKRAGHTFAEQVKRADFHKGEVPIHTIVVGTTERYSSNRNGDGFKEAACRKYHDTFVKHARWYRNHQNKRPEQSYGIIKLSTFNDEMKRIELIIALNGTKEAADRNKGLVADKELEKLAKGEDLPVSMSCFPAGTLVTTTGDDVFIENLKPGQLVLTHTGKYEAIEQAYSVEYDGPMVGLRISGLEGELVLTAEHRIRTWDGAAESWTKAQGIDLDSLIKIRTGGGFEYRKPVSGRFFHFKGLVYNLAVRNDESYVAEDVVVSNCRVPWDQCSGCGNKAHNRDQYCTSEEAGGHCKYGGLKKNITKVAEDGHVLHADNPDPTFFDCSLVHKPADRIAYVLGQIKSADNSVISGAELAETLGITAPPEVEFQGNSAKTISRLLVLQKLAEAETKLMQNSRSTDNVNRAFDGRLQPVIPGLDLIRAAPHGMPQAWNALAMHKIALPLRDFLVLISGKLTVEKAASVADRVARRLPGIYSRLIADELTPGLVQDNPYDAAREISPVAAREWAAKIASTHSLERRHVEKRLVRSALNQFDLPALLDKEASAGAPDDESLARQYALYKLAVADYLHLEADSEWCFDLIVRQNFVQPS